MKILHVIPVYEPAWFYGGPVRSVSALCRELAHLGLDITVYTTAANGKQKLPVNSDEPVWLGGTKVFRFPTIRANDYFYSPSLATAVHKTICDFDLVHITSIWNYPGLPTARAAQSCDVPYLYSARGSLIPESYPGVQMKNLKKSVYLRLFVNRNMQQAAAVHYTAQMEREESSALIGTNLPSFIIPNGIDCNEFKHLPNRLECLHWFGNLPSDSQVISYLGRLHSRKALDKLIQAFNLISKKIPNAFLLIGGPDYGEEATLRTLSKLLRLENRVRFLGVLNSEQRRLLFGCTDIFSLVGYGENFGMAAVEAMAAGLPVIVSENVCIHEDIVADNAGISVTVNEGQLADALLQLLSDPKRLHQMGRAARASASKRYEKNSVARLMMTAYEDILSGRRSQELRWSNAA